MFEQYLESVGASSVIGERVTKLYGILTLLIPSDRVPHIYISNVLDEERNLQWKSLWFYGPDYCSEFKDFQWSQSFDGMSMSPVIRWETTLENYDLVQAASDSKLSLKWSVGDLGGSLTAVGTNCNHLVELIRIMLLPHETIAMGAGRAILPNS
ncbi:hypothetical protein BH10ACT7_BH10ACT7_31810 [soil metagenome]